MCSEWTYIDASSDGIHQATADSDLLRQQKLIELPELKRAAVNQLAATAPCHLSGGYRQLQSPSRGNENLQRAV